MGASMAAHAAAEICMGWETMRGYRNGLAVRDAADKASDATGAARIDHDAGVAVRVGQPQCETVLHR